MRFSKTILAAILLSFAATASLAEDISADPNHTVIVNGSGGSDSSSSGGDSSTGGSTGGTDMFGASGGGGGDGGDSAMSAISKVCGAGDDNSNAIMDPDTKEIKIFSVGVKCFENITSGLAESTIQSFSGFLAQIVYAVLILYVIFFGLKVASGVASGGRLKGEAFTSAIKIAFVGFLVYGFDNGFSINIGSLGISDRQPGLIQIYQLVIGSYHSILTIVMPTNGFGNCSDSGISGGFSFGSNGTDAVWQSMDCMFSKFIGWNEKDGYATGSGASDKGGIALLFGFIFSKALPANGFFVGGLLFTTLMTLMMGFFRLALVYIMSMIALIMLFSIGPLMIPLMLFKRTESYFDGWVRLIIGVILQPIILFAFFSFIGGLLSDTIQRIEKLFSDMKGSYETSGYTRTGNSAQVDSQFVVKSVSNALDKMDKEAILNGVVILVIAYLLITFIKFVGDMAAELSGSPQLNLQGLTPKFVGGNG